MERVKTKDDFNVLDTLSPALKYEAMLKECGGPGPTEEKIILVFKVLDQIIPHTGVFTKLMQMCRDEIFEAVYSDQYTSDKKEPHKYIQRIPYFTLVKRVYTERDENIVVLEQQLSSVEERLATKQKQYLEAVTHTEQLQEDVRTLKNKISDLEKQLKAHVDTINSLEKTLEAEVKAKRQMQQQLEGEITALKEELEEINEENAFLKQYKNGFDDLQRGFQKFSITNDIPLHPKKTKPVATKYTHLMSDIENSLKIERQLLMVQNGNIEEFDKLLEQHEVETRAQLDTETDSIKERNAILEQAEQQLEVIQERFRKAITDTTTELKLLRQHKNSLLEQLQSMEENKPALKNKKKNKRNSLRKSESGESENTDGSFDEESSKDPFVVDERIFSKYAAMLYTSDNNGKTYHEFKGAKFCQSCGEKTVLCPHKILQEEQVFPLPFNVTHLKITRPKVRVSIDEISDLLPEQILDRDGSSEERRPTQQSEEEPLGESQVIQFKHSVLRLWEDYERRVDIKRTIPRFLPMNRVVSMIEHFAAYILYRDDTHHEEDDSLDMLDSLYIFMGERYQGTEALYLVVHDFISALIQYSPENKFVWLLTQVLTGNLDGAVFRYTLLLADFVNNVQWMSVDDFKNFAAVIYPSLTEDDLETLQMGYVSFSENKISKSLLMDYLIYMIMKYREPRFLEMETSLLASHCSEGDCMTEEEFTEASDQILGVPDQKLRRRLFRESEKYVLYKDGLSGGVPILRLSQILSYLHLLSLSPIMMQQVCDKVEEARAAQGQDDTGMRTSHVVEPQFKVVGMSDVKKLGKIRCF